MPSAVHTLEPANAAMPSAALRDHPELKQPTPRSYRTDSRSRGTDRSAMRSAEDVSSTGGIFRSLSNGEPMGKQTYESIITANLDVGSLCTQKTSPVGGNGATCSDMSVIY